METKLDKLMDEKMVEIEKKVVETEKKKVAMEKKLDWIYDRLRPISDGMTSIVFSIISYYLNSLLPVKLRCKCCI